MNFALLSDGRLLFIMVLAAAVAMLSTLNIAARPAAIRTKQVALALAVSAVFFMFTRFANLFYLPILATYVDRATRTGQTEVLYQQIQWVVVGAALGAFFSWILLPTFTAIYERGIRGVTARGSMLKVLLALPTPRGLKALWGCWRSPLELKTWLQPPAAPDPSSETPPQFEKPWGLLSWNTFASAVWTVGALAALQVSALFPQLEATSVLLSGVVNSFAAIAFSIFVDPRAAVITDQAVNGKRPAQHVLELTFYLGITNFIGSLLGLFTFPLAIQLISFTTAQLGEASMSQNMWLVVSLNALVSLLMTTSLSARISAVTTRRIATALAIYNVFFLVTRLTTQIYAPILGSVRDEVLQGTADASQLLPLFRWVVAGATLGGIVGWALMPTFVEIYNRAIAALEKRQGSMTLLLRDSLRPSALKALWKCLRLPSTFQVKLHDLQPLPKGFLVANIIVVGIHVIGVLAAIQAGAELSGHLARTATLLSSVINGGATILGSLVVDPWAAKLTDEAAHGERSLHQIEAMALFLCLGGILGTVLSQVLFTPSVQIIVWGARLLNYLF